MSAVHRVGYAPDFALVREVTAVDAALPAVKTAGLNLAEFDEVVVEVTLDGPTGVVVEPVYWVEGVGAVAGSFVRDATSQKLTVPSAAGLRKIVRVAHHGSVFFEVTGLVGAGSVFVHVAGVPVFGKAGS